MNVDSIAVYSTKYINDAKLLHDAKIMSIIPHFSLIEAGDLSFNADILGMPNNSSYCAHGASCCAPSGSSQKKIPEMNKLLFLSDIYSKKIKNDTSKKLTPMGKRGVSIAVHYQTLSPINFSHMEIGMVNQAYEHFKKWVDDVVEKILEDEKAARSRVHYSMEILKERTREKEEGRKTVSVEIMQKNVEIKELKVE